MSYSPRTVAHRAATSADAAEFTTESALLLGTGLLGIVTCRFCLARAINNKGPDNRGGLFAAFYTLWRPFRYCFSKTSVFLLVRLCHQPGHVFQDLAICRERFDTFDERLAV